MTEAWSLPRRIAFRWLFAYAVLFVLPFPLTVFPWSRAVVEPYFRALQWVGLWLGRNVVGVSGDIPIAPTGGGDRTIDYLVLFARVLLALAATGIWSLADRKRASYGALHDGLRVMLRYYLAYQMITYAIVKILHTQFPLPLGKLVQTFGQSSPMSLLWTFMAHSPAYQTLTGLVELCGAVLLFSRRTTTAGALVILAAMGNVVALNFTYDVPVKLHSLHLWLTALVLALPDWRRLVDALAPHLAAERLQRSRVAAKCVAIAVLVIVPVVDEIGYAQTMASAHPLTGLYDVVDFRHNGRDIPAALDQGHRWRRISIERQGVRIIHVDDSAERYRVELYNDSFELESLAELGTKHRFSWTSDGDDVVLEGAIGDDTIRARLRRLDWTTLPLTSRGFHWITEVPVNR